MPKSNGLNALNGLNDSIETELLPWQSEQWQQLVAAVKAKRLPHAMLFSGPEGVGKKQFATSLSRFLLCHEPIQDQVNSKACGKCNACQLFAAGTHPDFYLIRSEEEGKAIKVEQIRELTDKNNLTSHISEFKVHLIIDGDRMNRAAANSLLKTLEEPSSNTLILLITSKPELLSATIRSRCQQLRFEAPPTDIALNWLNTRALQTDPGLLLSISGNAPLKAEQIDRDELVELRDRVFADFGKVVLGKTDPSRVAETWQKNNLELIIYWMTVWVIDIIRLKYNQSDPKLDSMDKIKGLQKLAEILSIGQLFGIYQQQLKTRQLLNKQLNTVLLLENLLVTCTAKK